MQLVIIITLLAILLAVIALVIGMILIASAADEMYRELDDRDQAAYLRRWKEEKERKKKRQ